MHFKFSLFYWLTTLRNKIQRIFKVTLLLKYADTKEINGKERSLPLGGKHMVRLRVAFCLQLMASRYTVVGDKSQTGRTMRSVLKS